MTIKSTICSLVILLSSCSSVSFSSPPSDALLNAISKVESNNNPNAVGDNGKAIGIYQIHLSYWKDAIEHDPSIGGSYEDCKNPEYARKIVIAYMDRYAPKNASDETLARIHNGGPMGYKKASTKKYWNKVKKELK